MITKILNTDLIQKETANKAAKRSSKSLLQEIYRTTSLINLVGVYINHHKKFDQHLYRGVYNKLRFLIMAKKINTQDIILDPTMTRFFCDGAKHKTNFTAGVCTSIANSLAVINLPKRMAIPIIDRISHDLYWISKHHPVDASFWSPVLYILSKYELNKNKLFFEI
eukprot:UN28716